MGRLAEHALRLARLDPIYRVGYIGSELFAENSPQQIDELLDLLACVPFDGLIGTEILLNPTFGWYSSLVGGADADLVVDHRDPRRGVGRRPRSENPVFLKQSDQLAARDSEPSRGLGLISPAGGKRAHDHVFPRTLSVSRGLCTEHLLHDRGFQADVGVYGQHKSLKLPTGTYVVQVGKRKFARVTLG